MTHPQRPTPLIGDASSARERREDPAGWAMGTDVQAALADVIGARRDIRRYRSDAVPDELLRQVLEAGHSAPSVGHSQPWRFIVVRDPATRDRAAHLADAARIKQARHLMADRANRLLDLKLEGLREAPIGVVVACDRRTPATGVLGRATFEDTDLWSCACAIQNMWLTARALGLGMGWVTLFEPDALGELLHLPDGVETLGWMCLGWPDERPPEPGLQRAAWSKKLPLEDVIVEERWPAAEADAPAAPTSHLRAPASEKFTSATDDADALLAPPEALGVFDRALNRVISIAGPDVTAGVLVLAGADHPVTRHGISAYAPSVTADVMRQAVAGTSLGAAHAKAAGLAHIEVDAGVDASLPDARCAAPRRERGDLVSSPALAPDDVDALLARGREIGWEAACSGLVALGEVGVGNTTIAAALTCALLDLDPADVVGLGAGADAEMLQRKDTVLTQALERTGAFSHDAEGARRALSELGGGEFVILAGVVVGAAESGSPVILDGLATSIAALAAVRIEPSAQAYLIAGQQSREVAHGLVLADMGLEPLLQLRLRAGEGIGASLAAGMLLRGLEARRTSVRTKP